MKLAGLTIRQDAGRKGNAGKEQTSAEFTECTPAVTGRQGDGSPRYPQ